METAMQWPETIMIIGIAFAVAPGNTIKEYTYDNY